MCFCLRIVDEVKYTIEYFHESSWIETQLQCVCLSVPDLRPSVQSGGADGEAAG